jgi:hypothetical protein
MYSARMDRLYQYSSDRLIAPCYCLIAPWLLDPIDNK